MTAPRIQTAQFGLNGQTPNGYVSARVIAHGAQIIGDIIEHGLCRTSPVEWALYLNGGRLRTRHTRRTNQRPKAVITSQRQHHALNAGIEAQAMTGEVQAT
jgi:hypothetical protein